MTTYRTDLLARLVAMEHEALDSYIASVLPGRTGIDAKPSVFYQQASFPYIVHRVGASTPNPLSEDASIRNYDVFIRVVIGHLTANYEGSNEELVDEIIPRLEDYLIKHEMLTTDTGTYHTEPTWILPEGITIADTSGVLSFQLGGINAFHVGEELSLSVPVIRTRLSS